MTTSGLHTNHTDRVIEIPVIIPREDVLAYFKQERTRAKAESVVDEVINIAREVARPKGLYRVSCIGEHDRDGIEIDDVRFTSRVLTKNLRSVTTVVPEIVTCGQELDEVDIPPRDFMRYYCLDIIKTVVMFHATEYFFNHIKETFGFEDMTHLHPGEFADWPISEQHQLFRLFEDTESSIGVKLTSATTLQPIQSGSGLIFSNGNNFESCQLCLQANCAGRRRPYDPRLVKRFTE